MSIYLSRMRSALASIFFFSAEVRLPFLTCCDPLALALRACDLSGMGYLRSSGSPKSDFGSLSRLASVSSAIVATSLRRPASAKIHKGRNLWDRGGRDRNVARFVAGELGSDSCHA